MPVSHHMPGQLVDPLRQQGNLDLRGTAISLTKLEIINNLFLFRLVQTTLPFIRKLNLAKTTHI